MGQAAENVPLTEHVSRREMDEFAGLSQQRAVRSQQNGFFQREIIPITPPGAAVVNQDDGPKPQYCELKAKRGKEGTRKFHIWHTVRN